MQGRIAIWPALLSAAASVLFHAAHAAAMIVAAGATGLHAHAHHAQGGAFGWTAWLGWGANAVTLALCVFLFASYVRHRRDDRRKAASHLAVCLTSFAVVAATTAWSVL
ncbi:hypothetical protein [Paenibacillus sp.]|uniref:hypothetical protein n=1 Tax=Paenibacillus sp. TaxID=58172 RepID=UPI002811F86E|nr:hypothetical protein [Paenibacillus sp.]